MSDVSLRKLERDAAEGGAADKAAYIVGLVRAGRLDPKLVEILSKAGHVPSMLVEGRRHPENPLGAHTGAVWHLWEAGFPGVLLSWATRVLKHEIRRPGLARLRYFVSRLSKVADKYTWFYDPQAEDLQQAIRELRGYLDDLPGGRWQQHSFHRAAFSLVYYAQIGEYATAASDTLRDLGNFFYIGWQEHYMPNEDIESSPLNRMRQKYFTEWFPILFALALPPAAIEDD